MELNNKYFHSVKSYFPINQKKILDNILYKLECVLKCGYIHPYKEITKLYEHIDRHPYRNFNGDDKISIAMHPNNADAIKRNEYIGCDNAFDNFTLSAPSIVLNESLKEHVEINPQYQYPMERQYYGSISLEEYMDGISILPGYLIPFFDESCEEDYLKYARLLEEQNIYDIEFLDSILNLLNKYGYNVPLIDIKTGKEYKDNDEYRLILEHQNFRVK